MPGVCAAPNCKYNTRKLHVFRFPRDVLRCSQWLTNCNRPDLMERSPKYLNTRCRLCEKHFEDDQFMNASKSRLTWRAVPTIFDASDPPESEKRQKFKHSFLLSKRKRTAVLSQSCSVDHTYFAALEESAQGRRMKTDLSDPAANTDALTLCVMSGNVPLGHVDTYQNKTIGNLYNCLEDGTRVFKAVDTPASDVAGSAFNTENVASYFATSSFGTELDNGNLTESANAIDPITVNVTFQNCSSDVTVLPDGNIFANSNVVGQFNANTNVITFFNSSMRDEAILDNGSWIGKTDFGASLKETAVKFQEEFSNGMGEGSLTAISGVTLPLKSNFFTFSDSSCNGETLLTKQIALAETADSVYLKSVTSQKTNTTLDILGATDSATNAAGTIRESSRTATVLTRKRKRRKALTSEKPAGSVDHTYATDILRKSLQNVDDSSGETFSKEQGMLLVEKILSMQKEALAAAKRSEMKSQIPTVESVVQGAVKLGLKDSASQFFASQLRNCVRNSKGHRWSELDKAFARDLFVKSKEAYKVLEDFFYLPSAATLQRHAKGLNFAGSNFEPSEEV